MVIVIGLRSLVLLILFYFLQKTLLLTSQE